MFATCNNNPVCFSDPTGHAIWGTNTVAVCDGGTSRFIYNQKNEPYGGIILEAASVAHGGCGPVAVNNALQLLGNNSISFDQIIDFYRENSGIVAGGYLGTSFVTAISFLTSRDTTQLFYLLMKSIIIVE